MTDEEEKELRNRISTLEIRNLELVEQLSRQNRTLGDRFTDDEIVRVIKMVDTLRQSDSDYY